MLEFRYDTQLLIEGENLDEDAISELPTTSKATACWRWAMRNSSKSTTTPTSRGKCWSTALPSGKFTTSSWRIWIARPED